MPELIDQGPNRQKKSRIKERGEDIKEDKRIVCGKKRD